MLPTVGKGSDTQGTEGTRQKEAGTSTTGAGLEVKAVVQGSWVTSRIPALLTWLGL
jgi:hypothetical protein